MFKLEIETDSDAFKDDARGEIARILSELVNRIYQGKEPSTLQDLNGNTVGRIIWAV